MVSCLPVYWDGGRNERTQGKGRKISLTKAGSMEPTLAQSMFAGVLSRGQRLEG